MICPSCGFENAEGAKFCNECGAPLVEAAPATMSEERKVVSVLFCDLVGFTAASEAADPEDVRARIRPYHASLRAELERYGGTVEKFIGDAVMAVFGAPVAHRGRSRAGGPRGASGIEAIAELNDRDPTLNLQVRVGIDTGEAVVSLHARPELGEGMVAGDVVNTAARIQAAAPVDGVAVSEETFRQTGRMFVYEPLPPVGTKGKSEPVPLYRAVEARERFGADLIRTQETLFVGREVEKTLLQGLLDRCARDSAFELATLVGEPGVGKSRLCAELFQYVDERSELVRWRQGRCLPYGEGITFWALGEIVKSHAGVFDSDSRRGRRREARPGAARGHGPVTGCGPGCCRCSGSTPASRPRERSRSRRGDGSSRGWPRTAPRSSSSRISMSGRAALLDFLSYLAEWAGGVALFLLCTARPELFERHLSWGAGLRNAHTINLAPLSESETSELVEGLLEQTVSEQVRLAILERAGGNPLYAEEFVRLVADRGLPDTGDGLAFPDSVQALIAARLDTLSPERKSLLQDAAVVGKVFWAGALAAMGDRDEREVELALHELSRKELVRPARRSSMEGETEYAFWHALVRDVAYGQIPRAARARRHLAAAAWIEAKAGERVEDQADLLAHHYQAALELALATGDTEAVNGLVSSARRMLVLAGDRAAALDARAAESFYRRAVELYEEDDPAQAPLLLKAARTTVAGSQAERDAARAAALYRSAGDELGAAEALLNLSRYVSNRGDDLEQRKYTAEAERLVEGHPPGRVHVLLLTRRAGDEMMAGRGAEYIKTVDAAIALRDELGETEQIPALLQYRGVARGPRARRSRRPGRSSGGDRAEPRGNAGDRGGNRLHEPRQRLPGRRSERRRASSSTRPPRPSPSRTVWSEWSCGRKRNRPGCCST